MPDLDSSALIFVPFCFGKRFKRNHIPPWSSEELVFAPKKGGHRGNNSVVDTVFLGFLYPPLAWKVFYQARKVAQKNFYRWRSCTLSSSLSWERVRCGRAKQVPFVKLAF